MPEVTFVETDGTQHVVDAPIGMNLMQVAINAVVPGIEGDCGGLCACGTCHVYIQEPWRDLCAQPDELEMGILDFAYGVNENSRLSCQVIVTASHEGLVVGLPDRQY